ncbi:unnamed protein product [Thlaspi arvense]|uniref:ER membrane protein complex subunit 3 n=1 Tax=Thlaspi arvense TaxID=13288 RepID=A0AAU9T4V0_THLAR|nr:unnamed protein product [Thlaspi arvense]
MAPHLTDFISVHFDFGFLKSGSAETKINFGYFYLIWLIQFRYFGPTWLSQFIVIVGFSIPLIVILSGSSSEKSEEEEITLKRKSPSEKRRLKRLINGGRSSSRHGDQRLGSDPSLRRDGSHWYSSLLRLQAHAFFSNSRCEDGQRRVSLLFAHLSVDCLSGLADFGFSCVWFARQVVIRARHLKAGANFIPPKSFRARRFYFSNEENGLLHVPKDQAQNPQAQMFSDPNMAMDMMKKNLSMIIPQTLTFAWVNFFFSGFVAAKIPFPLTQRFRSMLQNGIDLSTVDVSYVSSRSWYFLNLFGLRGLFSLILGDENAIDDTQRMMQMGGFGFDASKSLSAEKDGLDIIQHEWALPRFEHRAESVLRKLVK